MKEVYVLGDSHVGMFFGRRNHGDFEIWEETFSDIKMINNARVGVPGATAHGLMNERSKSGILVNAKNVFSQKRQNAALVFGEVDVRWHIRSNLKGRSIEDATDDVIKRYEEFISTIIAPNVLENVFVFGGIPYTKEYAERVAGKEGTPLYVYTSCLEEKIKCMCSRNGWNVLSILEQAAPEKKYTTQDWILDDVHLLCNRVQPLIIDQMKKVFMNLINVK